MSAAVRAEPRVAGGIVPVLASGELRYSTVWEDHRLLERALPVAGGELLVIASAGCNVLNLLLHAPSRIVALDVNVAQAALLELKLAALRVLEHGELLALLGVREASADAGGRIALYERVRPLLPARARQWWDANAATIDHGIEGSGRLDAYIGAFRDERLARLCPPAVIDRILATDDRAARRRLVDERLFTPAFVDAFRAHFNRDALGARGRDPAQFRFVDESDVAGWFLGRLWWACTELPVRGNFYLERFLRGGLRAPDAGPPYLRPANHARLRALLPRVAVVTDDLDAYVASRNPGSLDGAALSDVFEYMAPAAADATFAHLARALRPGGRLAYWNLFVPRRSPAALRLARLDRASRALWRRDRAWFYREFHVEEVTQR